jgi:hypothetical protein
MINVWWRSAIICSPALQARHFHTGGFASFYIIDLARGSPTCSVFFPGGAALRAAAVSTIDRLNAA